MFARDLLMRSSPPQSVQRPEVEAVREYDLASHRKRRIEMESPGVILPPMPQAANGGQAAGGPQPLMNPELVSWVVKLVLGCRTRKFIVY